MAKYMVDLDFLKARMLDDLIKEYLDDENNNSEYVTLRLQGQIDCINYIEDFGKLFVKEGV